MADNAIFNPTFIAGEYISTANIVDGSFLVSPDQQKCFIDYAGERIEISDIITITTTALFQAITTPIFGKFYYITETEQLYLSTAAKWVLLTPEKFPMLFAIPAKIDGDPALHFALEVHDTADYSGTALLSIDTDIDQTGVTIFDGYEWTTFPSTGAGSFYYGNQIEVAPHSSMQGGKRYVRYKLYLAGDDPIAEPWQHTIYPMTAGPQGNRGEDGADGKNFTVDATGVLADLVTYNAEPKGFTYLTTDTGVIYIKEDDLSGAWSAGIPFRGLQGEVGYTVINATMAITYIDDATGVNMARLDDTYDNITLFDSAVNCQSLLITLKSANPLITGDIALVPIVNKVAQAESIIAVGSDWTTVEIPLSATVASIELVRDTGSVNDTLKDGTTVVTCQVVSIRYKGV